MSGNDAHVDDDDHWRETSVLPFVSLESLTIIVFRTCDRSEKSCLFFSLLPLPVKLFAQLLLFDLFERLPSGGCQACLYAKKVNPFSLEYTASKVCLQEFTGEHAM